jgi:ribosomal protein S18 acetylase RimI-like enzyme
MVISVPANGAGDGLRPVDAARDLAQIIDLLKQVFGDSLESEDRPLFGDGGANDWFMRFNPAAARLANGFVWQADGRLVGNATLLTTKLWDRFLVANVAVHPSYRRRGIARGLMQAVTASVRSRGGRVILLQVVKGNQPAIDLYRSLGYESIGNMTTWHATASRVRQIPAGDEALTIEPLAGSAWREAFALDTSCVPADLNWPEPLRPDAYRRGWRQRAVDFMNGRQQETWVTVEEGHITGLAGLSGEWGHSHVLTLRVGPAWSGQLERPLLAKLFRRLHYLPRRAVRIDHPENDTLTAQLLTEANMTAQRTLTHMRLELSR